MGMCLSRQLFVISIIFFIEAPDALTVFVAIDQAISRGFTKVEFESDSYKIIFLINFGVTQLNQVSSILDSFRKKNCSRDFGFFFVSRSYNIVVHALANCTLSVEDLES